MQNKVGARCTRPKSGNIDTDKGRVQRAPTVCFLTKNSNYFVKEYAYTFKDLAGKLRAL